MAITPIIDTADTVSPVVLTLLERAGIKHIIRYLDRANDGDNWKQIHPQEARTIGEHGLKLGLVYEGPGATPSYFTRAHGQLDGQWAVKCLPGLGAPQGACVYFAVDFDPEPDQLPDIAEYFHGVRSAMAGSGYRVGAYSSGACAALLRGAALIDLVWITCSLGFNGSRQALKTGNFDLFQGYKSGAVWRGGCDRELEGLSVDYNTPRSPDLDWGSFVPFAAQPPGPPPPPPPATHDVQWLQQKLGVDVDGIVGPITIAAMIKYVETHNG